MLFSSSAAYFQPTFAQETTLTPSPTPFLTNTTSGSVEVPEELVTTLPPVQSDQATTEAATSLTNLLATITPTAQKTLQSARLKRGTKFSALARKSYQAHEKIRVNIEKDVENSVTLTMVAPDGKVLPAPHSEEIAGERTTFVITPPQAFVPGKYQLLITDSTGETFQQDFTWGVLAINTNKSIYAPHEKAYVMMGVLNEQGSTICDARLTLTITKPDGQSDVLATDQGDIKINEDCKQKAYTPNPDYFTTYDVSDKGIYDMQLSADTVNGNFTIQDRFEVRESVPFDIERSGPTRIYPPKAYDVEITVKANEDFSGYIEETTPFDFTIIKNDSTPFDTEEVRRLTTSGEVLGTSTATTAMPFDGETVVTTKFGEKYDADHLNDNLTAQGLKGHDGIDFALEEGTKVKSVDKGMVTHADSNPYGKTVIVEHTWGTTYYGHLSSISVKNGDMVTKGQEVGTSGNTGNSTGPHLHFAIAPHGTNIHNGYGGMVDPAPFLGIENGTVLAAQDDLKTNVRVLKWKVDLKKGDVKSLKYSFKAPDISPEFYLLGPLTFKKDLDGEITFQEIRKWQIAADADVTIDSAAILGTSRGTRNTVFISTLVGYHFFVDDDSDLSYLKTTDGGASWTGLTDIKAAETIVGFDVWYDKWTPGDTGTKIHIWYVGTGADDIIYESLDTANNDAQTSEVIAFNGATAVAGRGVFVSGAKMRGGNLYVAFDIDAGAEKGVRRSTDGGANWTIRYTTGTTDTIIEATLDQGLVFPGNEADNQDMWLLYHDASADALTLKVHDDSANSTSESSTIVTLVENTTDGTGQYGFAGSIRHSDGHLLVVTETEYDTATADMRTWDINGSGSITEKTAISTDIDDQYYPQIYIDQSSGEIRVAYIGKRDGTDTLGTTNGVYYTTSTDGMANWSSGDTTYSATSSDWRNLWTPLMGPRFIIVWRDLSSQAIMTNYDNSIPNVAPTVSLNSPADTASTSDTTPTFDFTGTDADTDSIEYNVQIHTDNGFGSTISKTDLTSGSGSSATSFNTASISPGSNKLILLAVASRVSGGGNNIPTATGNGLTWQVVQSAKESASWNMVTILRAMGSSPTSGAVTIDFAGQTQTNAIWSISEYDGVDTSGSNGSGAIVQDAENSAAAATSLTVTLGTFSAGANATYGAFVSEVNQNTTFGSGFTEIHETNITDNSGQTQWKNSNDTTVDWSWTSGARVAGIGLEIKAAAPLIDVVSETDAGFVNPDTGGDTHPFNNAENIQYTVQAGDTLATGTYYWRVRGLDPAGTNSYGSWSSTYSFTVTSSGPTLDQVMRHGNWFSSGAEQSFTF